MDQNDDDDEHLTLVATRGLNALTEELWKLRRENATLRARNRYLAELIREWWEPRAWFATILSKKRPPTV